MPRRKTSPDREAAVQHLTELWAKTLEKPKSNTNDEIDRLINSNVTAIRFSLPTQLLGKLTDPKLNCLCLSLGNDGDKSRWAPRPFCTSVIVPWMRTIQNVLGASSDPYVGNPLRRNFLDASPDESIRGSDREDWALLYKVLDEVQERNRPVFTLYRFLETLRSIKKRFEASNFDFIIPGRVRIEQVNELVSRFLAEGSGGDRGLAVAAALFETFANHLSLYDEVRRFAINASDASTGQTADIECYSEGSVKLAIEVKERQLTLIDVQGGASKAKKAEIREMLFNAPATSPVDRKDVDDLIEKTWGSGTNLYRLSIHELINVGLVLAGENGRRDFLINVGTQLNAFNTQPTNRFRWKELLESL